ncbi:MAG: hypothetical protein EAZ61_05095 [Oscillatoriales cyanobacterium]|nr:MAG: hypothetical protein EAZ61_05095 [Oscillatoriales cyanobacterium]
MSRAALNQPRSRPQPQEQPTPVTVIVQPQRKAERVLSTVKHVSSVACSVLLVAAGLAYGDQVYVNVQTENARNRLTALQDDERQLNVSIEALKYQAAQLGESPNTDLIPQTPDRFIFVEPSLSRPERPVNTLTPAATPPQFPVGY